MAHKTETAKPKAGKHTGQLVDGSLPSKLLAMELGDILLMGDPIRPAGGITKDTLSIASRRLRNRLSGPLTIAKAHPDAADRQWETSVSVSITTSGIQVASLAVERVA